MNSALLYETSSAGNRAKLFWNSEEILRHFGSGTTHMRNYFHFQNKHKLC